MDDADLPKALIKRIAKKELNKAASKDGGDQSKDVILNKDVLLALTESAKVFISYLTSTANDICKESKRQTISAEDVFTALDDLEFPELVEPIKSSLKGVLGTFCWELYASLGSHSCILLLKILLYEVSLQIGF